MRGEHTQLVVHTEVLWLSGRRILNQALELRSETRSHHATLFKDTDWLAKLCYLADIFSKLKEVSMSLQDKDKVGGSVKKAGLRRRAFSQGDTFSLVRIWRALWSSQS